jgi:cephalosporin-C deacetylase
MDLIKQQLKQLEQIDAPQTKRADFDDFWKHAVDTSRTVALDVRGGVVGYPIRAMEVRDITFAGLDGTRVNAWFLLPAAASAKERVPLLVHYHGASGSRELPSGYAGWILQGLAVLSMDFRMQGGMTGSNTGFAGQAKDCWFNLGLLDRDSHYFYHVWTDALRLIEVGLADARIDPKRVCVEGGSQGGATALAMAALHPAATLCMADVPSNCWFERRVFTRSGSANGVAEFLRRYPQHVDKVCETLSYYDNINLADRIRCPTLVSVGLKDPVCPPENVYAAYNKIRAPKEIGVYPFGEHDGGGAYHAERKVEFLARHFFG